MPKVKAQEADFNVACVARLFLGGHATRGQLQAAVDLQEKAYAEWDVAYDKPKVTRNQAVNPPTQQSFYAESAQMPDTSESPTGRLTVGAAFKMGRQTGESLLAAKAVEDQSEAALLRTVLAEIIRCFGGGPSTAEDYGAWITECEDALAKARPLLANKNLVEQLQRNRKVQP